MSPLDPELHHRPWSVFLRGMAMGAADIVPGVSGGTIAFITGIYFRLLQGISSVPEALSRELIRGRFRAFWSACDGSFLATLLAGIVVSIGVLASLISYLLDEYPIPIWSFFFGLIVASVWHVSGQLKSLRLPLVLPFASGVIFAWWVTSLTATPIEPSMLTFFFSAMLAICAMILPGISGSFILVILGMYAPVLDAIKAPDPAVLGVFALGCFAGLLSVARLITWAFSRFHDQVLALLIGFMVGALNKVWPWKQVLDWRTNSSGEQVPLNEASVSPFSYAELTGQDPQFALACLFAGVGFALVVAVELMGRKRQA